MKEFVVFCSVQQVALREGGGYATHNKGGDPNYPHLLAEQERRREQSEKLALIKAAT